MSTQNSKIIKNLKIIKNNAGLLSAEVRNYRNQKWFFLRIKFLPSFVLNWGRKMNILGIIFLFWKSNRILMSSNWFFTSKLRLKPRDIKDIHRFLRCFCFWTFSPRKTNFNITFWPKTHWPMNDLSDVYLPK